MKGIVFTEFLDLVEDKFGLDVVQRIIDECDLETGGVYSSVGTYSHKEMYAMVGKLSEIKDIPVKDLLQIYGEYFFDVLKTSYPAFMKKDGLFEFLSSVDGYIHPEVMKLYPDAELPSFNATMKNDKEMTLLYTSTRKMADFAVGLIRGAATHFKEKVNVEKAKEEHEGQEVLINIQRIG